MLKTDKEKGRGLTFKKKSLDTSYIFYYERKESLLIHMLFVFHSLDIIYLDRDLHVIEVKRSVKPFTPLVFPPKYAKHFIEIASDAKIDIQKGDKLFFIN